MPNHKVNISVRELIEYILRSGDINSVFLSSKRAVDGIRAHQKYQKQMGDEYEDEVSISLELEYDGLTIVLSGRIDGVLQEEGFVTIDEIKSTSRNLEDITGANELHWAQVRMYAYMYALKHELKEVNTRLTYIDLEHFSIKQFEQPKTFEALEEYFDEVIKKYVHWAKKQRNFKTISMNTIKQTEFPFSDYRMGQKKLMASVYKVIEDRKVLFSRAPTGIGKTIATLFPALKAMGNDKCEKIFYLTAKTIGKEVAANTLNLLEDQGLIVKRIIITAKDKICLNNEKSCNPDDCKYAKGHFDRINSVIEEMYEKYNYFNREIIESYAIKYKVCPYELTLDLALFCNVIICDYNYVFDPSAVLKRFFVEGAGSYTLLIDEAHNLVDRARDMYSGILEKQKVLSIKKKVESIDKTLCKYLNKLNKLLLEYRKKCEECTGGHYHEDDMPYECEDVLRGIIYRIEKIFVVYKNWEHIDELLEFYFDSYDFVKKAEFYSDKYITYYEKIGNNLRVKMFCIDPSDNIHASISGMHGVVYFSATLEPMNYYVKLLGGDDKSLGLTLPSPFERSNLCLIVEKNISTKYINRQNSISPIVESINKISQYKKGNYMVFFPSYKYMEDVYMAFKEQVLDESIDVIIQERGLSEVEKESFINQFHSSRDNTLVAFVVLGGMFGEGIDLTGDKLSGAIIIGVGLPQICYERNLIKNHFNTKARNGYEYAYVYPGMNKVMQSAGRVIRTINDRGVVVLVDERFNNRVYKNLFPQEWDNPIVVHAINELGQGIKNFWKTK